MVPNVSRSYRLLGTPGIDGTVTWSHSPQERRPQLRHSEGLKTLKTSGHSQPNHPESIRRKFGDDREKISCCTLFLLLFLFILIFPPTVSFLFFPYSSSVLLTFTINALKSSQVQQLQKSKLRLQTRLHTYTYLNKWLFNWAPCKIYLNLHSFTSVFLFLYNFSPSVLLLRPYFLNPLKFFTSTSSSSFSDYGPCCKARRTKTLNQLSAGAASGNTEMGV